MKRLTFQDQLRRSFMGYICVILAVLILLFAGGFALNFATVVVGGGRSSSQALSQAFQTEYDAYRDGSARLASSEELRQALETGAGAVASQELYGFINARGYKAYFILLSQAGAVVCSNFNQRNQALFADSSFAQSAMSRLDKSPGELLCFVCSAPLTAEQSCCYSFCRLVEGAGGAAGYLFLNLRQESFRESARPLTQEVLITDRYDNIIYTTLDLEDDPMDKLPSGKLPLSVERDGLVGLEDGYYYVAARTATDQELNFYTLTSLTVRMRALWLGLLFALTLLAALALLVPILTRAFARRNAQEIGELMEAVARLERDMGGHELSGQCSQESQRLYDQFRELIRHNNALQDRRRQMEVRQLEEQFNPHFVFNVMETVRFQIDEDPEAASRMLRSFASLMRYSIDRGQAKVSLETDVEYINDYLLLQKARYNNRLRYEFCIPEELLECRVPKLLLQPVVENSIKHGYRPGRVLEIAVEARQEGDALRFTVRDDGAGIDAGRLAAIRESLAMELNSGVVTHIGLYNLHKVLGLLYGPGYGLEIDSVLGEGTTVTLTIPMETEEDEGPC